MRTPTTEAPNHARGAIDLRRRTLADLAVAPIGTLVYVDVPGAAKLRPELEQLLRERGRALRDIGSYHLEIVVRPTLTAPPAATCRFCGGSLWCGRCRRCGTAA